MNKKITVVITAYNVENYLVRAIESVLSQTYKHLEIFIVDDGSKDSTAAIGKNYASTHKNVMYYHQKNAGVSVARNYGIEHATGEFIVFVDGDDYLDKEFVASLLKFDDGQVDIISCCCNAIGDGAYVDHFFDKPYTMNTLKDKERLFMQLLNGNYGKPNGKGVTAIGVPWGKLYRLSMLKSNCLRFDPALKRMQDNMFNMYAFYYASQVIYVDKPYYYYRTEHIQKPSTAYDIRIWRELLIAREKFYKRHNDILSPNIKNGIYYEKHIAMSASSIYISKNYTYNYAKKAFNNLRKEPVLADLFTGCNNYTLPKRLIGIRVLMKMKLWIVIYLILKIKK